MFCLWQQFAQWNTSLLKFATNWANRLFEDSSYHRILRTIMNFARVLWGVVAGILDAALFNRQYLRVRPNFIVTRLSYAGNIKQSSYIPSLGQRRSSTFTCFFFLFPATECRGLLINWTHVSLPRNLFSISDCEKRLPSFSERPYRLWDPTILLFSGYRGFLSRSKAAGRWRWPFTCV